jgi:POT family proton-dependent oligopeptide transporter
LENSVSKGHPKGLYVLFFTEMWERFSYYGMRAIFTLYMIKALLFDKALASEIYGSYTGLVYLTPLLGGYIADRYWGNRRSILFGGILMAIGQACMFMSATNYSNVSVAAPLLYLGLGFLIFGNGFFKPNISTMVGQLYPEGDKRVDSAFTIFYMGINLGAFIAPLACGFLGDTGNPADFRWGFLAACIGMVVSTISFELLKNKYVVTPDGKGVGLPPVKKALSAGENASPKIPMTQILIWSALTIGLFLFFDFVLDAGLFGSAIYSITLIGPAAIITDKSLSKVEKDRIWVIYILAFFVIFFWAAFEQAGASLTFFAEEQTNRNLLGYEIPASYFQSINAVLIVILAPVFALIWTFLGRRNAEPASPTKQAFGLLFLSIGYLVIAFGVKGIQPEIKVSMFWLFSLYLLHTIGELCLSPIGLSMVVKLAPIKFASLLMGVWFLSTSAANKFAGTLSGLYPEDVKLEQVIPAKDFQHVILPARDSLPENAPFVVNDSTFWVNNGLGFETELSKVFVAKTDVEGSDSVYVLQPGMATWSFELKAGEKEGDSTLAVLKNNYNEVSEAAITRSKLNMILHNDPAAKFTFTADGKQLAVWKRDKIEIWNHNPVKPKFAGFEITGLYEFFLIFVVLSGIASMILFVLSKKLQSMMHGLG